MSSIRWLNIHEDEDITPVQYNLNNMMQMIQELQAQLAQQQQVLSITQQELAASRQAQLNNPVQPIIQQQPPQPPPTPQPPQKINVNPPEEFQGKREHTKTFISQCHLVFKVNPLWSEDEKIVYLCSHIRGIRIRARFLFLLVQTSFNLDNYSLIYIISRLRYTKSFIVFGN